MLPKSTFMETEDSNVSFIPPGGDPGLQEVFSPAWEEEAILPKLIELSAARLFALRSASP